MKKIKQLILLASMLLSVAGCHTQNKLNKEPEKTKINMELNNRLNDDFETFDIQWLKENATEETPMGKFIHYNYRELTTYYYILLGGNDESGYN